MPNITSLVTKFLPDGTCEVEACSVFSGKLHKKTLAITREQFVSWQNGALIQNAMPKLSPEEREFLLTGTTQEEWDEAMAEEDDLEVIEPEDQDPGDVLGDYDERGEP